MMESMISIREPVVLLSRIGLVSRLNRIKWFVTNRTESINQLFEPRTVFLNRINSRTVYIEHIVIRIDKPLN